MEMMTQAQAEEARQERLNEIGIEPPCPFCNRPRVTRSDYIRCNPCGTNWNLTDDLSKDPRIKATRPTSTATKDGAETAK